MRSLWWIRIATTGAGLVAVAFLAGLLRASDAERDWAREASRAIHRYALAERSLQIDLLDARIGLLRNYDPVNQDLGLAEDSLGILSALPASSAINKTVLSIEGRATRQEKLVERFKSNNALLQNALARFAAINMALPRPEGSDQLAARVLRLTLDTSPDAVRSAQAAIAVLAHSRDRSAARPHMLRYARLLVSLLPRIDQDLHDLRALELDSSVDRLRVIVADELQKKRAAVNHMQTGLIVASISTLALLAIWLLSLRANNRDLQRLAESEHLNATIAGLLIDAGFSEFEDQIRHALKQLSQHIGAERAFVEIDDDVTGAACICWPVLGEPLDAWPAAMIATADSDAAWIGDMLHGTVAQPGAIGEALREQEMGSVLLIRTDHPLHAVLGFQSRKQSLRTRRDVRAGLSAALAAILQAARRRTSEIERIQIERRLGHARRMETIGAMASGVAHNFNNIIGAIAGFSEIAQLHTRPTSVARRNLNEIRDCVDRARELVSEMLDFARQGRGRKETIDTAVLVEDAVRLFTAAHPGRAINVETAAAPQPVVGNAGQLQQVLLNVCNNAAQASAAELAVRLTIRTAHLGTPLDLSHGHLESGDYIVIAIQDQGSGISAKAMPRLFEPFFTMRSGGTGLGLSTAWEIVQDHGGTIDVWSEQGRGSIFALWLPVAKSAGRSAFPWQSRRQAA